MMKHNMKAVIIATTVWLMLFAPLSPIIQSANAQTRRSNAAKTQKYVPSAKPGTPAYYRNPNVRGEILDYMRRNGLRVGNPSELQVGGDPQVDRSLGEDVAPAQDDEQDILVDDILTETGRSYIDLETVSRSGRLYVYRITRGYRDIHGELITVRRVKITKTIVMTINCGNATWEVRAGYTFDASCKPLAQPRVTSHDETDSNGYTIRVTETDDGCKVITDRQVITKPVPTQDCQCIPGNPTGVYFRVGSNVLPVNAPYMEDVNQLRKMPTFTVEQVAADIKAGVIAKFGDANGQNSKIDWMAEIRSKLPEIVGEQLVYLRVEVDPCINAQGTHDVTFQALFKNQKKGGLWKWIKGHWWVFVIPVAIFIGYEVFKGGDLKKITPVPPRITPP